jgi:HAD superfamily hydrolase (TIGR01450 family)
LLGAHLNFLGCAKFLVIVINATGYAAHYFVAAGRTMVCAVIYHLSTTPFPFILRKNPIKIPPLAKKPKLGYYHMRTKRWGADMTLKEKRLFLLDMDGTIYLGDRLFDHTLKFLEDIILAGAKYVFFTNNSSKSTAEYVKKLGKMGVVANESQIISSTKVTAKYLMDKYGEQLIYAMGTLAFKEELAAYGLNIADGIKPGIVALVMGFDTELTFNKLHDACILLENGVDYIATNCDLVCPTEFGAVPDCGSIAQILENATGRKPIFMGKPAADMVHMVLEQEGCAPNEAILIGDRLYTDIACGIAAGIDTALVLSGEAKHGEIGRASCRERVSVRV